jgi:hypothetical protein
LQAWNTLWRNHLIFLIHHWVHPKRITFWGSLTPKVLTEKEPIRGIDPPLFKFVYRRRSARSGHDTRAGIIRVCAWMYLFKNYAVKDWMGFAVYTGIPAGGKVRNPKDLHFVWNIPPSPIPTKTLDRIAKICHNIIQSRK